MTARKLEGKSNQRAGSPSPGEPVFLVVGKLRRPHGVHGEMIMDVYTDFPERLEAGVGVYIGEAYQPILIKSLRRHGNAMLLALSGFDTPEEVGVFRNQLLYVRSDDRPALPEGDYYHHQIVGLRVVDRSGKSLGTVVDILETGANDILVIEKLDRSELMVPVIDSVVLKIDLSAGELCVDLLPGLLPEE
jgi:16S rRNA processing protein RimM